MFCTFITSMTSQLGESKRAGRGVDVDFPWRNSG